MSKLVQKRQFRTRAIQRYVEVIVAKLLGLPFRSVAARPSYALGIDITLDVLARDKFPFSIMCPIAHNRIMTDLLQAKNFGYEGTLPAVVWRPRGHTTEETLITFNLAEFTEFWGQHANQTTVSESQGSDSTEEDRRDPD